MNLYEMTLDAVLQIETFVNPNISEWLAAIDPVLAASGSAMIGKARIASINLLESDLHISIQYYCRGCEMVDDIYLDSSVIQDPSPLEAAVLYRTRKKLEEAKRDEAMARQRLDAAVLEVNLSSEAYERARLRHQEHLASTLINAEFDNVKKND